MPSNTEASVANTQGSASDESGSRCIVNIREALEILKRGSWINHGRVGICGLRWLRRLFAERKLHFRQGSALSVPEIALLVQKIIVASVLRRV